jgi:hypothetical protein
MVVMALWASGRGCSDMTKAGKQPMSTSLNLKRVIAFAWERGRGNVWTLWFPGYNTRQKRELLPRRAQRKKILPLITLIGRIFTDRREMLAPQRTQRAQRRTRFEHTGKNAQTIKFYCAARGHTLPMQARIGLASMCAFK